MRIRAIITGATGMVGEGVMHECLLSNDVESVLVINRRYCKVQHPKLKEIIIEDFFRLDGIRDHLKGYNACFFCAGISSIGLKEDSYNRITYELTLNFASILATLNPDMCFCYVSGMGTDSSEKGRVMWARVKGKTENHLMSMPFRAAYMFRPGFIQPSKGLKNTYKIYKVIAPFVPLLKWLFPNSMLTLEQIGKAMINSVNTDYEKKVLEVKDIAVLAYK